MDLPPPLLAHVAATWALVGLIWVVQLVSYPSFADVGPREFPRFHEAHCARITRVVAPLMGVELASGLWLLYEPPPGGAWWLPWAGAGLLAVVWVATAALSVPVHAKLRSGTRARLVPLLVTTNWVRTLAWSARGGIVLAMLG